jgi:hypothetical protein
MEKINYKAITKTKFIAKKWVIEAYHNKVINHLFASLYILNIIVEIKQNVNEKIKNKMSYYKQDNH